MPPLSALQLENTLLDGSARPLVKLADFGFSKDENYQSAPGSRVGTPAYLAPEVIANVHGQSYDAKVRWQRGCVEWWVVLTRCVVFFSFFLRNLCSLVWSPEQGLQGSSLLLRCGGEEGRMLGIVLNVCSLETGCTNSLTTPLRHQVTSLVGCLRAVPLMGGWGLCLSQVGRRRRR